MLTQELIERGGSKLEATRLFLEESLDIPIPRSVFLYSGQSLDGIKREFEKMGKPIIVRGSHRNDWHGMIGVVPTTRDINHWEDLEDAIRQHESFMRKPEVRRYAEDEGMPYTQEIHHLIQEQSSDIVGSMLRHPNDPNRILVRYREIGNVRTGLGIVDYYEDTKKLVRGVKFGIEDTIILELIDMYKKIEKSGLLEDGWSYHVEFGFKPLMFFQVRPFKKIETADFDIDSIAIDCPHLSLSNIVGITPREGTLLPFTGLWSPYGFISSTYEKPACNISRPYGLYIDGGFSLSDDLPITIPLGKMEVFITPQLAIDLLHGMYRIMKRARVSAFAYRFENLHKSYIWDMGNARVFSNGKSGLLVPEK